MAGYLLGMVCLNGHPINEAADTSLDDNSTFCPDCGEATITRCPACQADIRGFHKSGSYGFQDDWKPRAFCHECGVPYPWTQRNSQALTEALELAADQLSADEREALRDSIRDLLVETPRTQVAATRFKRAIAKAGSVSGKLLADTASRLCVEAAKQYFKF